MEQRNKEIDEFGVQAHQAVDWMVDYLKNIRKYPVKPNLNPGDIKKQLPLAPPENAEKYEKIFQDFQNIIVPGITHWQHPGFLAYFPTGSSEPSILAEMFAAALAPQCMVWATSPAAEELEDRVMEWTRDLIGLPSNFTGVIQDTSSASTLLSFLTAREWKTNFLINKEGYTAVKHRFRVYCSTQTHSCSDKGVKIAGFGIDNLVKIGVDKQFSMIPEKLEESIIKDIAAGYTPLVVVSTIGSTSSTAIDPIPEISKICQKYKIWHHVDASYAGTALILPEFRWMGKGLEEVDSFVFNPHKWLFVHSENSAYFVKDKKLLVDTFSILPEFLKTPEDRFVNNYRDWGIPLGRRFRALKLWFVYRYYGAEGIRNKIRDHILWAQNVLKEIKNDPDFEILAPAPLNLLCFRYHPKGIDKEEELEHINSTVLNKINSTGKIMITHTKLDGKYTLRFVGGNHNTTEEDIKNGWLFIKNAFKNRSKI